MCVCVWRRPRGGANWTEEDSESNIVTSVSSMISLPVPLEKNRLLIPLAENSLDEGTHITGLGESDRIQTTLVGM